MIYKTFSDMMLDNRHGIEKGLNACEDKAEIIEKSLDAYGFAVVKGIEHHECYKLLRQAIIDELGQDVCDKIEKRASYNINKLAMATAVYYNDVKNGKRVGYSAEEDVVRNIKLTRGVR